MSVKKGLSLLVPAACIHDGQVLSRNTPTDRPDGRRPEKGASVTAYSPERLAQSPVPPEAVFDELALRIEREPKRDGDTVSDDDGLWVGRLRRMGAAMVARWGYPGLVESAELLISELVTNALRYGADDVIAFRLVASADAFVIEVDDGSPGRPQVRAAGPDEESGRGMLLVSAVADEWGVSADGTCTWCVLKLPLAGHAGR